MKKAILILEQQSWHGGAQRVLDVVLSSLANDFDPIVAFPDDNAFSALLRGRGIATCTFPLGAYRPGKKTFREMLVFALRSFVCTLKIAALIRKKRIALVYINGPRCLPAGAMAAWLTGRPSLFHLHLILARKSELFIVVRAAKYVTKILACSRAVVESLIKRDRRLASKTTIIYNPAIAVSSQIHNPTRPLIPHSIPGQITLGMVGRLTETKGHERLLNAISRLRPELQDKTRLIVVGAPAPGCPEDIQYMHRLEEFAARSGLQEKIFWAGYQPDPGPYYELMDVLLHPSATEALGLAILEALQRGIPVIASQTGGIPEIVKHESNGLLVSLKNEGALVRSLERFIDDQSLRAQLVNGAREGLDSRFSPEAFKCAIRDLVCGVCDSLIQTRNGTRRETFGIQGRP